MLWKKKLAVIFIICLMGAEARKQSVGGGRGSSGARQGPPPSNTNWNSGGPGGAAPPPYQPHNGGFAGGRPNNYQPGPAVHPGGVQPGYPGGYPGGARPGAYPPQGGFHPNYNGGRSSFQPGSVSGPGSTSSGSHFKSALAGAALGTVGGLLVFEAGKAILHSADKPFQNNNKDYYFDQQYVPNKAGEIRCTMPLNDLINSIPASTAAPVEGENATTPSPNQVLQALTFANGTRPHEIAWACKQGAEVCCGTDCCPAPPKPQNYQNGNSGHSSGGSSVGAVILGVIAVLLLICCCGFCIIYHFCRSVLDCIMPSRKDDYQLAAQPRFDDYRDESFSENNVYPQHPNQSYPMQQYPPNNYDQGGAYPTQTVYPPQPQAYQGYPPQPQVGYAPAHY
ncbi:hypothetical protein QR680_013316 [Steinernema hermaphroditum]|uniref:CX domain-containing protein n=1 Tax=Steinernema hermaphroditum TaxID=289476 RepID=A0AA39M225_9BILA|nr:hypothetical protein QR680_013316 [Steinernema hermaphroditum]